MNRFNTYFLLLGFISMLAFPLMNSKFNFIKDINNFENRKALDKPEFNIELLDPFPLKYENYYNDHFNLRSGLIRLYNLLKLSVFKRSPMPEKVIIGKDGWLFGAGDDMNSYLGKNKLSEVELNDIKNILEKRARKLSNANCKYYLLIAPSKASIYTEKLSYEFHRVNALSWGEQVNTFLKQNSFVQVIDVFSALRKNKDELEVYHKLDNHWNDYGALISANEAIKVLKKEFPKFCTLPLNTMTVNRTLNDSGNMQKMLGYLPQFKEVSISIGPKKEFLAHWCDKKNYPCPPNFPYPWEFEEVKCQSDSTKPKLLIISDSFGKSLFPFLAENFSKSVKIFDSWLYESNDSIIANEKPDVVILLVNEPLIRHLISEKNKLQK